MSALAPRAFFSYVRQVEAHDGGRLSRLRERLQGELQVQTGLKIEIFQDIRDLKWGDRWEERILEAAAGSLFLMPVISPGYFLSQPCRSEYLAFQSLQEQRAIAGVILPIYYVDTEELNDPDWREGNAWAEDLAAGQWVDWRPLRLEPWETPEPNRRVEQMARDFKARLKDLGILRPPRGTVPAASRSPVMNGSGARTGVSRSSKAPPPTPATALSSPADRGPASLPTRREIVVEPRGLGHFRTISEAIAHASADDVILIRAGTYRESIKVDKSITLLGDGPRENIAIETDAGVTIDCSAPFGRVVNLTIRRLEGRDKDFAVWIRAGRLELEGCDIVGASLTAVAITGDAEPIVVRNRIHHGRESGVRVYDRARGTIEDNDIFANAMVGIDIKDAADPTVMRNRIHDGKQAGIMVRLKGRGTIENNDIFANGFTGVEIREEGDPVVRRNHIRDGKQVGVFVHKKGRGVLEDNEIVGNGQSGVSIAEQGHPRLTHNRISRNHQYGIAVFKDSAGIFEKNDLRNNQRGPWYIVPESLPNAKRSDNLE